MDNGTRNTLGQAKAFCQSRNARRATWLLESALTRPLSDEQEINVNNALDAVFGYDYATAIISIDNALTEEAA